MLSQYLNGAINDLQTLITYTKLDIDDIKQARHDEIIARNDEKSKLIQEFETKKSLIDQEIKALQAKSPDKPLEEILDSSLIDSFGDMKTALVDLKQVNSDYARMVFAVSEFFTSLLEKIIPTENVGYGENKKRFLSQQSNLLQIQV